MARKSPKLSEEQVAAINYGRGSKHKNLIHRKDFLKLIQERCPSVKTLDQADEVFKGFCDALGDCLLSAHGLALEGNQYAIGLLHLRPKKATTRKNFQTGGAVEVPPEVTFRLRPAKRGADSSLPSLKNELTSKYAKHMTELEE